MVGGDRRENLGTRGGTHTGMAGMTAVRGKSEDFREEDVRLRGGNYLF
jgi:hypothetical protein